ncbi:MAG: arylsulfatase [Planctomycetota bacterium]
MIQRYLRSNASALLALIGVAAAGAAPTNIVFILADDLGYGDLSCYGQTRFQTPNLDRMAAEGLRFTQHYAGSTVCAPSRACLLTGQHTGHVYQRANGNLGFRPDPLDRCIASSLKSIGYATAMIGKSGLACNSSDAHLPHRKGFDHFFGYLSHGAAHRYFPKQLFRDGATVSYPGNHGKHGDTYSGDEFLADTLSWLRQRGDEPFFLHLALQQPHLDLAVPDAWREPFLGKFDETPLKEGHYRAEANPKATFAGMVTYLDDTVGKVLAELKSLGIAEETLVLFSSDNGAVTAAGWSSDNMNSSGPLRGCKRDLYEGGIRVPTIAWWPGTIEPGRVTDHVSTFWDFAPTACELTGAPPLPATDGVSYLPTLTGKGEQAEHDHLYWEFHERGGKQAIRMGRWKGVRLKVQKNPDAALELYDLQADLGETQDVSSAHPAIVREMERIMRESHVPTDRHGFGAQRR